MPDSAVSAPVHEVERRLDVRIPVRDGIELSANLWLPLPTPARPDERFPAILEMIPYGKDSWRFNADEGRGRWLAARGYALCRLDVRGTGSSEGVALDEYTAAETQDGYEAVEWLAAQPWCNASVGMWGISYGGFTAIQVAKLRPPQLKAIVPVMATDDRYLDDVHYRGGCKTMSDYSQYAVSQVAMNAMPPDPAFRGDGWREEWLRRLEATPPWLIEWFRQQHDGPYWRQGSLAPDYDGIEAAILQIGGWMDSYVDPVFRMQARCTAPTRSIVGNWVHGLPDSAYPAPTIDWLHELVRFFDRWLKGVDNDVMDDAALTWFERDYAPPEPFPRELPGRWRATSAFPHPAVVEREWYLGSGELPLVGRLLERPPSDAGSNAFEHRATTGTRGALSWGAGSEPNGLARDLRPDEAVGATYTSPPLAEPMSILGFPVAIMAVEATAPVVTLVARLTDVAPDGTSAQVAIGALNLTHRESHEQPAPLEPGVSYEVRLPMRASGYRFAAGHRIRVSLASQYWPVLWPSPYPCRLTIHHGMSDGARVVLPVIPPAGGDGDESPPTFKTTPPEVDVVGGGSDEPATWEIVEDVLDGSVTVRLREAGTTDLPDGRSLFSSEELTMTARDADPARAGLDTSVGYRWHEREFETGIVVEGSIASDADAFSIDLDLAVDVDGHIFFERSWRERIPRRLV
jgi:putative CocE/NonD family hydrolase